MEQLKASFLIQPPTPTPPLLKQLELLFLLLLLSLHQRHLRLLLRRATGTASATVLTPSFLLRILTYPCLTMSLKLEAMVRGSG